MSKAPASGAPAGSRRFWLTVLCFAIANAGIWVGGHFWMMSRRPALLHVESFDAWPDGAVSAPTTLTWRFNLGIAPIAPKLPPATIQPALAGSWHLSQDGRTLTFTPSGNLPRATLFHATLLADRVHAPGGFGLPRSYQSVFQTPALRVRDIEQASLGLDNRVVVVFTFDDSVLPDDLLKHLTIKGPDARPLTIHPYGRLVGMVARVITDPIPGLSDPRDRHIHISLSSGLAGASGPLGMTRAVERDLMLSSELEATGISAACPARGQPSLCVQFNNPIDANDIAPLLSVDPAVPYQLDAEGGTLRLSGAFAPATRYVVKIVAAAAPAGINRHDPRPGVLSVYMPNRTPSVWFDHDSGYLGTRGNRTILAHAVNASHLKLAITRVYDSDLSQWRAQGSDAGNYAQPIAVRDVTLNDTKNQVQDVPVSLDDLLPPSAPRDGVYCITLHMTDDARGGGHARRGGRRILFTRSDDGDDEGGEDYQEHYGDAQCTVSLSDIGLCAKQVRDGVVVWAVSLSTARPLGDVHVRAFSNKNQLLGEADTSADGLARIQNIHPAPGEALSALIAEQVTPAQRQAARVSASSGVPAPAGRLADKSTSLTWLDLQAAPMELRDADISGKPYLRKGYEAFIYTERGVYRPGETVHLRAIVRGPDRTAPASAFPVKWLIRRPDLHDWREQVVQLDADGGASLDIALPANISTGRWSARIGLAGSNAPLAQVFGSASFQVEEFMPDRMKVDVTAQPARAEASGRSSGRLSMLDGSIIARVQADYLFGRPVTQQPATLVARAALSSFAPDNWRDWTFGDQAFTNQTLHGTRANGGAMTLPPATLDGKGHAQWEITQNVFAGRPQAAGASESEVAIIDPGPWRITFAASVSEAGGRAVSAQRSYEVDRVPYYLGVALAAGRVIPGQATSARLALVSPDGARASADAVVSATLFRQTWNNSLVLSDHRYHYESTRKLDPVLVLPQVTLTAGAGTIDFTAPQAGEYVLRVEDRRTGCVTSLAMLAATAAWDDNISRADPEKLELVALPAPEINPTLVLDAARRLDGAALLHLVSLYAQRMQDATRALDAGAAQTGAPAEKRADSDGATGGPAFRVGQEALIVVRAPFAGRLLLSVETDGVLHTQVIDMPASHMLVRVPVTSACRPNAFVCATVIRPIDPNARWVTHRAYGAIRLNVDNTDRRLNIAIDAPVEVRPGQSLDTMIDVTDSAGRPVANAALTVAVVDEGICQLTRFTTPDPFAFFHARRALGVMGYDVYGVLMPEIARPDRLSAVGGDKEEDDSPMRGSPITSRRVRSLALFTGLVHTDASGRVRASFPMPRFSGQVRVMAVGAAQSSFGSAGRDVFVRGPLLVQSSWPRFAAPGDTFSVPAVVFNNAHHDVDVQVTLALGDDAATNPLSIKGVAARDQTLGPVHIRAGGQTTLWFAISAKQATGVAHARITATSGVESYGDEVELPVRPASPQITTGGYAVATPAAPAIIAPPANMLAGTRRLQLRVAPAPALELPRGLEYLDHYPYGCCEQTASGAFPLVYLDQIGPRIAPGLFEPHRVADKVNAAVLQLIGMQTSDGGLAMWPGQSDSWPWGSVYAAHFIVCAQAAGRPVPAEFREGLLKYVRQLIDKPDADGGEHVELTAYACYVLALAGQPDRPAMQRLSEIMASPADEAAQLGVTAQSRFHLAAAWFAAGRPQAARDLIPQTLPPLRTSRQLGGNLGSPIREKAILLDTLLTIDPDRPQIPALAAQLAAAGRDGQWRSTQDVAMAVMALGHYFKLSQTQTPYDSAQLFDGTAPLATSDAHRIINWSPGADWSGAGPLRVAARGPANCKAHVEWLCSGVPLTPPADEDAGLTIRRRYLDIHGKPLNPQAALESGELVRVELTIRSDMALQHIVIEDLLPAGLEIENPRLQTSVKDDSAPDASGAEGGRINAFDASRADVRDDRMIVVGDLTRAGAGVYVYLARAVTPGTFILPPVRAECMYDIGTHSLSGGGKTLTIASPPPPGVANTREE